MKVLFLMNVHYWERLGVLTLASVLREKGHSVNLINAWRKKDDDIVATVNACQPDIIAYSAMSPEISAYLKINSLLKKRLSFQFTSVFGGPHATFFPEMMEEKGVDAICRGEAETAIIDFLDYLSGNRGSDQVPNFWIREGEVVVRNEMALWPTELDAIPFPARDLWENIIPGLTQKFFLPSRGCPYKCTYCFNRKYNEIYEHPRPLVRRRSVDNLLAEIEDVVQRYPEIYPFFSDDSFILAPTSWLEEFREKYPKAVGRPYHCNIRADQVTEKKIRLLAESGCHLVRFGLECGDEPFANEVLERNLTNDQILETARLLHEHNIRIITQNINALPADDPVATDLKTLELNVKVKPGYAMAFMFNPFPGTELADYSIKKGLFIRNYSGLNDPLCLHSPLEFDRKTKVRLTRQNKLFALAVAFGPVRWLLPLLRRLPLLKLYTFIYFVYGGYCTRIKMTPGRRDRKYVMSMLSLFAKKIRESCSG